MRSPADGSNDTILVMCNSSATCSTLGRYLSMADSDAGTGHNLLESKLQGYFYWKAHVGKMHKSLKRTPDFSKGARRSNSAASKPAAASTSAGAGAGASGSSFGAQKGGKRPVEDSGEMSAALRRKDQYRGQGPPDKRRRVRGGGAAGSNGSAARAGAAQGGRAPMFAAATGANPEAFEEDVDKIADMCVLRPLALLVLPARTSQLTLFRASRRIDSSGAPSSVDAEELVDVETFNEADFAEYFGIIENDDLVIIRPYLGDEDDRVLDELRPKYVIMYDPTPAFVRRIEVRSLSLSRSSSASAPTDVPFTLAADVPRRAPRSRHPRLLPRLQGLGRGAEVPERDPPREGRVRAAHRGEGRASMLSLSLCVCREREHALTRSLPCRRWRSRTRPSTGPRSTRRASCARCPPRASAAASRRRSSLNRCVLSSAFRPGSDSSTR